ncbi:hypothetical protein [Nocardia tenerifensis]|uniref:hypothetical protein n=1 Tax=Nocardia tenerifensis TaxID=228006 RepID=UPI00030909E1|nr:hypothetical protein [Nocardia tenerifensis]
MNFSCSDEVWSAAKKTWQAQIRRYPTWTSWLEAAFVEKTARKRAELGMTEFDPAPDRLPPGRRFTPEQAGTRPRRAFSCDVRIWDDARGAWWAEAERYSAWSDWAEEAVQEKIDRDRVAGAAEATDTLTSKTP